LILNIIVPVVVLIALSKTSTGIEAAMPFAYLQAVLATSLVSLGITTGFDRRFGVLVRLGTTPLGRKGLVFSKILSLVVLQFLQLVVLSAVGLALGWEPKISWLLAFPICWIASFSFAGIALSVAGRIKAEANLGLQNLIYLVMMGFAALAFGSGNSLPSSIKDLVAVFPSSALHKILRSLSGLEDLSYLSVFSILILAVVLPLFAARKFRFDE
jgi:ABC-2 type transport system permease protein